MIPTLLIVGYLAALSSHGRMSIAVAAVLWPLAIVFFGDVGVVPGLLGGAVFAAANTALGVLVGYYSLKLSCYLRGRTGA